MKIKDGKTNEEIIVQGKPIPKTDYFFINGEIYV